MPGQCSQEQLSRRRAIITKMARAVGVDLAYGCPRMQRKGNKGPLVKGKTRKCDYRDREATKTNPSIRTKELGLENVWVGRVWPKVDCKGSEDGRSDEGLDCQVRDGWMRGMRQDKNPSDGGSNLVLRNTARTSEETTLSKDWSYG